MHINHKQTSVELSGRLLEQLEQYAQEHGITTDEAAARLVSQALQARYVRKTHTAPILPLRRTP